MANSHYRDDDETPPVVEQNGYLVRLPVFATVAVVIGLILLATGAIAVGWGFIGFGGLTFVIWMAVMAVLRALQIEATRRRAESAARVAADAMD